ncbi:hypothetical protein LZ554_003810 [Drepanopeziza brunnea f. sp. 'monogermtubi']|nr:hypothetical protein LZ554_003810 [Drepanopeziza brunnea f. sp. 'monogermtubi']
MDSEWLREGIRIALKTPLYHPADNGNPQTRAGERDPRLRKLIEKILFSRRFILTYHAVIIGFVLVLSVIHWTKTALGWRRRRASRLLKSRAAHGDIYDHSGSNHPTWSPDNEQDVKTLSSSHSRTISPRRRAIDENEETPLLESRVPPSPPSVISTIRAALIYQPRPIPFLNKVLPSNGISAVVLAFLALNLFYLFYDIDLTPDYFIVLADRFGLVFSANIPLLYLLAAKNQPLRVLTGRSYESLNIFHRRLGELLCLEGLLHALGFLLVWYALFKPAGLSLLHFLLLKSNFIGTGILLAYELLYFTSLAVFRQRWYELFLGLHIVFQILALLGLYFHHTTGRPYVLAALVIFILDRLIYRFLVKSTVITAQLKILEDEETVKLTSTITLDPKPSFNFLSTTLHSGWHAPDHIFITVPSLSHKHTLQAHPFTIASPPPQPGDPEARLELLIRAQDGFSRDLLNAARLHTKVKLRVDGPYGSPHSRTLLEDSSLALLVAGGSGIAVAWPLLHHLLAMSRFSDTESATGYALRRQKVILIWVTHETSHLSWLGREALAAAENLGAEIIVPRATEEAGRPDLRVIIRELVDLYGGKEKRGRTSVVGSGPDGMGRCVRNTCAELVREGRDVGVAIEKFGW